MGAGTRQKQYEDRFGLGQPVDTFGMPCPHSGPTKDKERVEALSYEDIRDKQSYIIWKQAINEAVQDSNLKALAEVADGLGDQKGHYEKGELNLILGGKAVKSGKWRKIRMRVLLPASLLETIIGEKSPIKVELDNLQTHKTYNFYKVFHKVKKPFIDIPPEIRGFQVGQYVMVKIRTLPIWEFVNGIKGEESWMVKFDGSGILMANLGGKEIPLESLGYDYLRGRRVGGAVYIQFQIKDVPDVIRYFRLYDNGLSRSSLSIKMREFRVINDIKYDAKVNSLVIKYVESNNLQKRTMLFLEETPGEIDFGAGRVSESMRIRVLSGNSYVKGEVGEEIATKIAEEKLKVIILDEEDKLTNVDREILFDGDFGIIEAKFAKDTKYLKSKLKEATEQIYGRFKECDEYKKGVAFSIYVNKITGDFEYLYKVVTPEKDKALPRSSTKKMRGDKL